MKCGCRQHLAAELLAVPVDATHRLGTGIVLSSVLFLIPVLAGLFLVSVVDVANERGNQFRTRFGAGGCLDEGEKQRRVARRLCGSIDAGKSQPRPALKKGATPFRYRTNTRLSQQRKT